ncbi:MAG: DOMON-like domain-containing protein [Caulobacter sp.]|nr:DOMON-like domain-containing protein [Caulobacter sp.]
MLLDLIRHSDTPCDAVTRVTVEATRAGPAGLALRYVVIGDIGALRLPETAARDRRDDLWKHSCFEVFLQDGRGSAYCEYNLSPSGQWAGYRFDAHRQGGTSPAAMAAPEMAITVSAERLELQATIALDGLADLPPDVPWRAGLTAVIEAADGRLSYWALAHAPDRADFHHPDTFVCDLELP